MIKFCDYICQRKIKWSIPMYRWIYIIIPITFIKCAFLHRTDSFMGSADFLVDQTMKDLLENQRKNDTEIEPASLQDDQEDIWMQEEIDTFQATEHPETFLIRTFSDDFFNNIDMFEGEDILETRKKIEKESEVTNTSLSDEIDIAIETDQQIIEIDKIDLKKKPTSILSDQSTSKLYDQGISAYLSLDAIDIYEGEQKINQNSKNLIEDNQVISIDIIEKSDTIIESDKIEGDVLSTDFSGFQDEPKICSSPKKILEDYMIDQHQESLDSELFNKKSDIKICPNKKTDPNLPKSHFNTKKKKKKKPRNQKKKLNKKTQSNNKNEQILDYELPKKTKANTGMKFNVDFYKKFNKNYRIQNYKIDFYIPLYIQYYKLTCEISFDEWNNSKTDLLFTVSTQIARKKCIKFLNNLTQQDFTNLFHTINEIDNEILYTAYNIIQYYEKTKTYNSGKVTSINNIIMIFQNELLPIRRLHTLIHLQSKRTFFYEFEIVYNSILTFDALFSKKITDEEFYSYHGFLFIKYESNKFYFNQKKMNLFFKNYHEKSNLSKKNSQLNHLILFKIFDKNIKTIKTKKYIFLKNLSQIFEKNSKDQDLCSDYAIDLVVNILHDTKINAEERSVQKKTLILKNAELFNISLRLILYKILSHVFYVHLEKLESFMKNKKTHLQNRIKSLNRISIDESKKMLNFNLLKYEANHYYKFLFFYEFSFDLFICMKKNIIYLEENK